MKGARACQASWWGYYKLYVCAARTRFRSEAWWGRAAVAPFSVDPIAIGSLCGHHQKYRRCSPGKIRPLPARARDRQRIYPTERSGALRVGASATRHSLDGAPFPRSGCCRRPWNFIRRNSSPKEMLGNAMHIWAVPPGLQSSVDVTRQWHRGARLTNDDVAAKSIAIDERPSTSKCATYSTSCRTPGKC